MASGSVKPRSSLDARTETASDGRLLGRAVACSTFHHFADMNWDVRAARRRSSRSRRATEIERDPARFVIFKDYVGNIGRWLANAPATAAARSTTA